MLLSLVVVNVTASDTRTDANNGKTYSVWGGYEEDDVSDHLAGSGTADDPYLIQSAADLAYLAQVINDTHKTQIYNKDSGWYRKAYIVQTVDIDLAGKEWIPIGTDCDYGTFCGVYDGRGHEIINMKISEVHGLSHGLFGYLGDSGSQVTLSKGEFCGITNLYLHGTITAANNRVGGLVGQIHNRGHVVEGTTAYITNVTCNVAINLDGSGGGKGAHTGSDVENKYYFGGVVGISNFAVLENVVNKGAVTVMNCDSSHPIGGIIGRATRTILKDCVNTGEVTLETNRLNTQWNSGDETSKYDQNLSGTLRAGGVVGQYIKIANDDYLTFINCINKGNVTAKENGNHERVHAGGILGSLTYLDSMKTAEDGTKFSDYNLTFTNCANTGAISAQRTGSEGGETNAGGILGTTYHGVGTAASNAGGITIQGCANTGNIESKPNTANAGGITGVVHVNATSELIVIENCISNTTITNFVTAPQEVVDAITQGTTVDATKANNLAAANEALCMPSVTEICGFPTWGIGGLGSAESPFRISNFKELKVFANLVNGAADVNSTEENRTRRFENVYVKQTANITISGAWTPIGKDPACSFLGVYDGGDKTISGLSNFTTGLTSIGLFGYIGNVDGNTTLNYDCGIANLTVSGTISQSAPYVGGVVGKINNENYVDDGQIAYVINTTSKVTIGFSSYSSTADANWGGVVGYASSTIFERVENNGAINISGNIGANVSLGGIAGRAEHIDMFSCRNTNTVSFKTTTADYSGRIYVGGVLGLIYKNISGQEQRFAECINTGAVTGDRPNNGKLFVGGIVGGPLWGTATLPTWKVENSDGTVTDTGVQYRDYNIRFSACINTGSITANGLSNSGDMNASGILGSTYPGGGQNQNHGGIKIEKCASTGTIKATNMTRAAGITQAVWTSSNSAYDFGLLVQGCATNASAGGDSNTIVRNNSYQSDNPANPVKDNFPGKKANVENIDNQAAYACGRWSGYNINGFPTGKTNDEDAGDYVSAFLQGTGTEKDPFVIRSAADLRCFRNISNEGKGNTFEGNYIIQTADIELGGTKEPWAPIGAGSANNFLGVYNGQGHTIKGLYINGTNCNDFAYGLFGYIGNKNNQDSGVSNLTVIGSIVAGNARVGGLVGQINDRFTTISDKVYITNVTCDVDITISNYAEVAGGTNGQNTGTEVDNRHYFAGVAGFAAGAVFENVVNKGTITVTNAFADHPVGGIVGRSSNTRFISCTNEGDITVNTNFWQATVSYKAGNGYAAGTNTVTGIARAGGIVGLYLKRVANEWITFENCVNTGNISTNITDAASTSRVHAGGILGSIRYPIDLDNRPTYEGYQYTPYDISIVNSTNSGAVSATNQGSGETNAGGIIATLYDGYGGSVKNAGDITVKECVNVGAVSADRAAGIAGCVYNDVNSTYGVKIIGCMTKSGLGGSGSAVANKVNSSKCDETDSVSGSSLYDQLQAWNTSLMAPSLEKINGMPTAANVAIVRGLENFLIDLNSTTGLVEDNKLVIDENGVKIEKIDKPGNYRYVLRYDGIRPYVGEVLHIYYRVTYDKAFADDATISIRLQDDKLEDIFGAIKINNSEAKALNNYTSYGKTGAFTGGMIHVPRIFPQQFAEPIYTTFSYAGKVVHTHTYTMWEYANRMLNERTASDLGMSEAKKAAFNNLLIDLYKYAEEAQKLRWMKEPYATYYLTDAQKALGSKIQSPEQELTGRVLRLDYDDAYAEKYLPSNEIFVWKGAKLSFDHSIVMRIELKTMPADLKGYTVEATIGGKAAKAGFNDTYVYVEGFAPTTYASEVVINIYDANGDKAAMTVHYSVNTYLYNRWSADVYSPLVQALARYSKSAIAFINAN